MTELSINQGRILRNLMRLLEVTCGHSLYELFPRGVKVWLPEPGQGVFPDLIVVAGEPLLHQGQGNRLLNPCLLFEIVGAPSSGDRATPCSDQPSLFSRCQGIPYLQAYVFVYASEVRVEQFYRAAEHRWGMTRQTGLDTVVELAITNARLPMMDIYDRVEFDWLN